MYARKNLNSLWYELENSFSPGGVGGDLHGHVLDSDIVVSDFEPHSFLN